MFIFQKEEKVQYENSKVETRVAHNTEYKWAGAKHNQFGKYVKYKESNISQGMFVQGSWSIEFSQHCNSISTKSTILNVMWGL